MMKNFILDYINTALFIQLICSIVLILLLRLIINYSNTSKSGYLPITDNQYFVLNNTYDPKKIFYFITYKLYHTNIIELKSNEGKFYYNKNDVHTLSTIEKEISNLYINGLSPKEFTIHMIDEEIFKQYFSSVHESLIQSKFIKSKNKILFDKLLIIIGFLIILTPLLILLICLKGLFLFKILVNLLITVFIYFFFFKNYFLSNLTQNGLKATENFKKTNPYYSHKLKNDNCSNDMDKFLLQNIYMYYFDNSLDDDSDDDGSDE